MGNIQAAATVGASLDSMLAAFRADFIHSLGTAGAHSERTDPGRSGMEHRLVGAASDGAVLHVLTTRRARTAEILVVRSNPEANLEARSRYELEISPAGVHVIMRGTVIGDVDADGRGNQVAAADLRRVAARARQLERSNISDHEVD